ncbi:hypothetical protein H8356DRAFT_1735114 [Neocallimastix lanati (nom. inval.)]|uniref:Uncharacterized protein n=1 Tax=Neocallimastix californiae TaxID=1754190 RepID=A0A1Y2AFC5_9FUNG|nr:hypothetical protein H8356DRAFT_1735114 [Neocallimastix sp. JGI-2020a]ORY21303.1 hypothetical protein LY90DRAFT_516169 [Neocallimastix californiae]|eukprot:ORY21303.1 hypothetical protein LY90DRAFT_516169 [Neocallimastix californiae]
MENDSIDMEQEDLKMRVQETIVRQKNISDAIAASEEERHRRINLEKQEDLKARVQENIVRQKNIKDAINASEEERNRRIELEKQEDLKARVQENIVRQKCIKDAIDASEEERKRREQARSYDNLSPNDKNRKKSIENDLIHEVQKRELKRNSISKESTAYI